MQSLSQSTLGFCSSLDADACSSKAIVILRNCLFNILTKEKLAEPCYKREIAQNSIKIEQLVKNIPYFFFQLRRQYF